MKIFRLTEVTQVCCIDIIQMFVFKTMNYDSSHVSEVKIVAITFGVGLLNSQEIQMVNGQ